MDQVHERSGAGFATLNRHHVHSGGGFVTFDKYQDRSGVGFVPLNKYLDRSGAGFVTGSTYQDPLQGREPGGTTGADILPVPFNLPKYCIGHGGEVLAH